MTFRLTFNKLTPMNATEIQALSLGDKVKYLGKILTVADWVCHKDLAMLGSTRLWAEPLFSGLIEWGGNSSIHPSFWGEIEKI